VLSDVELTRAAQSGDVTALGALLARHEAGMRADPEPDVIDDRALLGSLAVPALVRAGIPDSRLVVFERSGHFAHLEEPEALARAVVDFVAR
jgi:pimeloyl-ACP methyl ester carboxylesterase